MSFLEQRLDDKFSYGFQVTPRYRTTIVEMENGKEQRNIDWSRCKREYSSEFLTWTKAAFAAILSMFHSCMGSAHSFRMKDWTDYEATLEPLGNTPGANSTPVQLIKTYTNGALVTVRTITKPVAATVTVYQGGVAKPGTLDTTTGLFTPTTNWTPAAALTWTGEFDVPVRFADDALPSTYENFKKIRTTVVLVEDFL